MIDFLEGVGATGVSMAFPEVIPSLQRGVIDCGVTGTLSGNTAGWPEVTTHQYKVSLGWAVRFTAVNLNAWNRFDPKVREFFTTEFAKYEDHVWKTMREALSDADNCNSGNQPCTLGKPGKIAVLDVKAEDQADYKKIVETKVLSGWAKRCGAQCTAEWNDTVGKALDLKASAN